MGFLFLRPAFGMPASEPHRYGVPDRIQGRNTRPGIEARGRRSVGPLPRERKPLILAPPGRRRQQLPTPLPIHRGQRAHALSPLPDPPHPIVTGRTPPRASAGHAQQPIHAAMWHKVTDSPHAIPKPQAHPSPSTLDAVPVRQLGRAQQPGGRRLVPSPFPSRSLPVVAELARWKRAARVGCPFPLPHWTRHLEHAQQRDDKQAPGF